MPGSARIVGSEVGHIRRSRRSGRGLPPFLGASPNAWARGGGDGYARRGFVAARLRYASVWAPALTPRGRISSISTPMLST